MYSEDKNTQRHSK